MLLHSPRVKFDSPHRAGMRFDVVLVALALALAGCSSGDSSAGSSARSPANSPPPPPAINPGADAGATVYTMACARCHGPTGAGDGELSARLGVPSLRTPRVAAMAPAEMAALIRDGRGAMPPHGNRLPPAQIEQVSAFVRGLTEKR
jgi:mono/diheme cytochrome c family protein